MIPFNKPMFIQGYEKYIADAIEKRHHISGDGFYTKACSQWMQERFGAKKVFLTTSGTDALEMAALLCGINPGDEVIMPSFTFSSTANAFVLRGAKIVFVDIRKDTLNIDESLIEPAITSKTKAICAVHYAGVGCDMRAIMNIASRYNLLVIEDAAHAVMAKYDGVFLGTIGHMAAYSFHETKNYSMGEGGALLVNDEAFIERAEIVREKGTNRSKFFRGEVDKYTWVDIGSSYLPSELNAAYLYAQLEHADEINRDRLRSWRRYYEELCHLERAGHIELPVIPPPENCEHNAHMFYIKLRDIQERDAMLYYLKSNGIGAVFHYIPLHSSPAGNKYGRFHGTDVHTTRESERLLRLPMYYGLSDAEVEEVVGRVCGYFRK